MTLSLERNSIKTVSGYQIQNTMVCFRHLFCKNRLCSELEWIIYEDIVIMHFISASLTYVIKIPQVNMLCIIDKYGLFEFHLNALGGQSYY